MKSYRFHPEARRDARSAALWYRDRSPEAARSFTAAIAAAIRSIREHPERWPVRRFDARCRLLRDFPFSIFYIIENDVVVIVAVAHDKRRPGYWSSRLDKP